MKLLYVIVLLSCGFLTNNAENIEHSFKTLYSNPERSHKKTIVINRQEYSEDASTLLNSAGDAPHPIQKRSTPPAAPNVPIVNDTIIQKLNYLNDTHKQLMVHWVGEGSNVIICLARDPAGTLQQPVGPSAVYISYDYGDTYDNKTELFKLPNGSYAILEKFYNHPKYNTHFVFADVIHNLIYVTTNHGHDFKRFQLEFTPNEIIFHELYPSMLLVLDKTDPMKKLWLSPDFEHLNFASIQDYVKAVYWMKETDENQKLVVQRMEPNGLSTIIYSSTLFSNRIATAYSTNVQLFSIKGNFIFTTKMTNNGTLDLYVSYKLGKQLKCIFDTTLPIKSYFVVDVTSDRALVAVSHSDTVSHLYVSENLNGGQSPVQFTLSLEDVLCYFPNSTWHDTWIPHISEDAFADVYKVEGLTGIYIASRVIQKPVGNNLGPQHLGTVITFDHGRSWRLIKAPSYDIEGQQTPCAVDSNCSLHLSQKFSHLYPDTRSISILSSESAPGIIIATGVLGKSLKGHYGVYVSTDAGLTWRQTLRELFFFNMGDHGGILTAVKYFKSRGETRHVLYSTDEGETWKQAAFHDEDIRLYGLMTEPGENTTVFTMFGSLPQEHQWIIVKLDLIKAFTYNCSKDDYKNWSPSQSYENRNYIPCRLGQQVTYQRRMPHANCYNGLNLDAPISMMPCECDIYDYECDFGFIQSDKLGTCVRDAEVTIDPYKVPSSCKPGLFYNRTKGYRKIQGDVCVNGFKNHYQPEEIPCPFKEVETFLLFAQRESISRFNLVTRKLEELPIRKLRNVIAIDFDIKNNCVYWADIALDTIGRQCLSNNSEPEILVASDLASIEGMALDWISNTLYFVDGMRSKIELIRTDIHHSGRMRRTVLGPNKLKKPRGIALHPKLGYMFWTDWSAENPSVNRADLDGSNILRLFGKPQVEWPNGITIDYIAERIYWVDARQDYIASSDLHGDSLKIIVSHDEVVSHPFAVAVFKNSMFWDDWKRNAMFTADKDTFRGVEVLLKQLPGLMDLKVYAHGLQIGTNACTNTTCPYVCVGKPKIGRSACLCPDGMEKYNDKCMCPGHVAPFTNSTCPKFNNTCSPDHFTCTNGNCVPKGWRCDGENDCGDNSDELKCEQQSCPPSYFVCGDGKCLPKNWKCDYDADCSDGSDELNCPKQSCTEGQFPCANGRCIAAKWKCDGENDCRDGSDEIGCVPSEVQNCKSDEFRCKDGGVTCIPPTWRCDGEKDCRDGSDETDCVQNSCSDVQFSCGPPTHRCIYTTWVCDGDRDCVNGTDEMNCHTPVPDHVEPTDQFISKNGTCIDWMFKCSNSKCIPFWWKCDHADDCGDGSDEIGCHTNTTTRKPFIPIPTIAPPPLIPEICDSNQFRCDSGGGCIFSSWVCDGMEDCVGGEDELNCGHATNCTKDQFKCRKDGSCIPLSAVCNGHNDCPDGTDESSCEQNLPSGPANPSCSVGYFPCDGNTCQPAAYLCDGKPDCKDGFDELNCSKVSRVYQVLQMGVDERGIDDKSLLLYWWIPTPDRVILEFQPSISKVGEDVWTNKSWTNETDYKFDGLSPFTKYNMTIYVRIQNTSTVFPPAKYYIANTGEGIPSEPWNITAKQKNGSHILISWQKPIQPNGIITNYQICWYPPLPPIKLKLSGNETAHLLAADFQHNENYTFYVIAHNKKCESKPSETTTITFDGDSDLDYIQELTVVKTTNNSITLTWKYPSNYDGFNVTIFTHNSYPNLSPQSTNTTNITIKNLAPGARYNFKVNAYKKSFVGPEAYTQAVTDGVLLPEVPLIQGSVTEIGTTVKLSWERPKDQRKVDWMYGVYYGIDQEELFEKPRVKTTNLTTTISGLEACELYIFSVGVVGPYGYGPLSKNSVNIRTKLNKRAPPKNVKVEQDGSNILKMRVEWLPSCPSQQASYVIEVFERTLGHDWSVRKTNPTDLSHVFNIVYGAIYDVKIATDEPEANYSRAKTYYAPPIPPPYEVRPAVEINGSFIVYWQEREVPKEVGSFKYEVLVSEGNTLNETTAEKFLVDHPPFVYTNATSNMFTFAVRIKAESGYKSVMSERISLASSTVPISGTSLSLILGLTVVSLFAICGLVLFIIKHRRLQNSFTRFANSHYDTRSGAATFDDNGLEEEESPQIVGFSDDEPLVIA